MPQSRAGDDVRKRLARQVTSDYNAMLASGDILSGEALPVEPPDGENGAVATQPPPAPPTPEPAPETPETPAAKYAGKYQSVEALEQGYTHMLGLSSRINEENRQLKEQLARQVGSPPPANGGAPPQTAAPRVNPAQRNTTDWIRQEAVVKLAETTGIDPLPLAEFARTVAAQTVEMARQEVGEQLAPIQAIQTAQARFNALHPEAAQFQSELAAFTASMSPDDQNEVQNMIAGGNLLGAMKYTWAQFRLETKAATEGQMKANSKVAEEERTTARAAANLPPSASPATPIRAAADQPPDPKYIKDLQERARNHDADAQVELRRLTFGRMMHPSLRTWEGPAQ
jgi:hypothetical protein